MLNSRLFLSDDTSIYFIVATHYTQLIYTLTYWHT